MEDIITEALKNEASGSIVPIGNVGYRENVLPSMKQAKPDILLYREAL